MSAELRRFAEQNLPTITALCRQTWRLIGIAKIKTVRVLKWVAITTGVLLIIALALHTALSFVWSRQLEHRLAAIRSRGEPVTAADLRLKPIPDSENAAVIYQLAFKAYMEPKPQRSCMPGNENDPSEPIDILFWDQASERERDAALPGVRRLVEMNSEALRLTEEAASRPKCVFKADWGLSSEDSSYLHHMRQLVALVLARAVLRAQDNEADRAVSDFCLALKLADDLMDVPLSIMLFYRSYAVKVACRT